jgi:hypothetical protein
MEESVQPVLPGPHPRGLVMRLIGVLTTPRETFAAIVARPQWIGAAVVVTVITAVFTVGFLMTEVGRLAIFDQQVRQIESLGTTVSDQMYSRLEQVQRYMPAAAAGGILVGWPIRWLVVSGILMMVFNGWLDGTATFPQVFAVVVHASVVQALQAAFVAPVNYLRESIGGATSLGVFFPMLSESSFLARLLGAIDLFTVWWIVLLSIGLSVLYGRRTRAIAVWFFGLYGAGALILAAMQAIRGGA